MKKIPFLTILLASALLISCSHPTAAPLSASATPAGTSTPAYMSCTILHIPATPPALGADFGDRGHISGPTDAPVTIVVFSDYQCPACAFLAASLKQIRLVHTEDVRLIYINTPLSSRDKDALSTQAVEAAAMQGKFWEMHDLLFEKLAEWSSLSPEAFVAWVSQQAASLGLDQKKFQVDFQGKEVADHLHKVVQSSTDPSISPPILFVNSTTRYAGLADAASLDSVIRMEALSPRQFSTCPSWIINPLKQYLVTLHTIKGDVVIQLFPDKAPMAVDNFVSLARAGWYDGITFYKMIPEFLVMSGDPSETGMGNPGYLFKTETSTGLRFDKPGLVAMDNSGRDTNGSRFLITLAPAPQLNDQFTIFGKVLSGLEVLSSLSPRDPRPGIFLPPGDKLLQVNVEER
jgi:cyclophilin family peptidyl-prolyl cis-trans isomerase/protein-disulfide isomerase